MEKNISEEELLLRKRARRRLLGAITLVIAAVIILPLIFDDEPRQEQREIIIHMPASDSVDISEPSIQLVDELPRIDGVDEEPVLVESQPSWQTDMVQTQVGEESVEILNKMTDVPIPMYKPERTSVVTKQVNITSQPTATTTNRVNTIIYPTATATSEFVVQLGAFSDHAKARHQQQNLVSNGINAYTEALKSGDKDMMRVRVGPFSTRSAAEAELENLKRQGLNGVIVAK